jgi:hypothetical protein
MRSCFIVICFISLCAIAQTDFTEDLIENYFLISSLNLEETPSFEIGDTIHMRGESGLGALYFKKRGNLKMIQVYRWCGTTSFFEGMKILMNKSKDYQKSFNGSYKYFQKEEKLVLTFRGRSYEFLIIESCYNRHTGFTGFDLRCL